MPFVSLAVAGVMWAACRDLQAPNAEVTLLLSAERTVGDATTALPDVRALRVGDVLKAEVVVHNRGRLELIVRDYRVRLFRLLNGGGFVMTPSFFEIRSLTPPAVVPPGESERILWRFEIPPEFGDNPGRYLIHFVLPGAGGVANTIAVVG